MGLISRGGYKSRHVFFYKYVNHLGFDVSTVSSISFQLAQEPQEFIVRGFPFGEVFLLELWVNKQGWVQK